MTALSLDPDDRKKFKKYSLGMKQKLGIAGRHHGKAGGYPGWMSRSMHWTKKCRAVGNILREEKKRGTLILLSCHDKAELDALADEVFCLESGRLTDRYFPAADVKQEDAK